MKRRPWIVERRARVKDAPWHFCAAYGTEISAKEGLSVWRWRDRMWYHRNQEFRVRNRNADTP